MSSNGREIVAACADGVRVCDSETGQLLPLDTDFACAFERSYTFHFVMYTAAAVWDAQFHRDGWLITAGMRVIALNYLLVGLITC